MRVLSWQGKPSVTTDGKLHLDNRDEKKKTSDSLPQVTADFVTLEVNAVKDAVIETAAKGCVDQISAAINP